MILINAAKRGITRRSQRRSLPERPERQINVTKLDPGLSEGQKLPVMLALGELRNAKQDPRGRDDVARRHCGIERQCEVIAYGTGGAAGRELRAEAIRIGERQHCSGVAGPRTVVEFIGVFGLGGISRRAAFGELGEQLGVAPQGGQLARALDEKRTEAVVEERPTATVLLAK